MRRTEILAGLVLSASMGIGAAQETRGMLAAYQAPAGGSQGLSGDPVICKSSCAVVVGIDKHAKGPDELAGAARDARSAAEGEVGIQWVSIPGGSFTMGDDSDGPRHRVSVKSFQMARTLVTNKQYRACVDAGACKAASDYGGFSGDDQPVVGVGWSDAKAFSEWAGGRLPSEAEWEYAARSAGKDRKYPWGDEDATCERAVVSGCGGATAQVCSRPEGNTEQGLCDMAGNAWEWVQDWYFNSYDGAPTDGSAWESPKASRRVVRGGSWCDAASGARAAGRDVIGPVFRGYSVSFRPVR